MAVNEYDDMIAADRQGVTAPSERNEYDDMIDSDREQGKQAMKSAMFVASKADPDRRAKALQLANRYKLPVDTVERQFDVVSQKDAETAPDYDRLLDENPKLSAWLQDHNNAAVARDDLDNLAGIERTVRDHSMMTTMYSALNVGLARMYSSAARIPSLAYDAAAIPQNLIAKYAGIPDLAVRSPEWLRNNPVAKYYDEAADTFKVPELERSIVEEIAQGNYSRAGMTLAAQFVANAPQQAALLAGAMTGLGTPALIGAGLTTAADANKVAQESGVDPAIATVNALAKGTIEAGFESVGTFGILKTWEGIIAKQYGKEVSKQVFRDFAKTIAYSVAAEGNEEALTSIAQDVTDYVTGVNPQAMDGIAARALDAGIIGGFSGGLMTGPSAITSGLKRGAEVRQSTLTRDFYLQLGKAAEAAKLRQRSPEMAKAFTDNLTENSPINKVIIAPEALETYFQSKNINPTAAMQEAGAIEAYTLAKETGTDVEVPLSLWNQAFLGTEHYQALADDVKFEPTAKSVNELKQEAEDLKAELEQQSKEAEGTASPQELPLAEEQAKSIRDIVSQQLQATGQDAKTADSYAKIYEAGFRALGERSGINPLDLFSRYALQIRNVGQEQTAEDAPLNLNQSLAAMEAPQVDEATKPIELGKVFEQGARRPEISTQGSTEVGAGASPTFEQGAALDEARGRIQFGRSGVVIEFSKAKDASTLFHETGHFYLEVLGDLAARENSSQQIKDDYGALLNWFGVTSREEIKTEHHEKFARGFEAYLMEGKAPSQELRRAFAKFRVWLISVYRQLKALNVELTDDVRQVMDRMLATDEEIASVRRETKIEPLFVDPAKMGMSEKQTYAYLDAIFEAEESAKAELDRKLMADYARAQSRAYKGERVQVRTEVEKEISERPVYQTIDKIKANREIKLSKAALDEFGKDVKKQLPRGVVASKADGEGVHPDVAAQILGYSSGVDLVSSLTSAQDKKALIEQVTDLRMAERFPDLLTNGKLPQEALNAYHNQSRSKLLRMELEHLVREKLPVFKDAVRRVAQRVPTDVQVREQAQRVIDGRIVRDIRPSLYQRAEIRAAKGAGAALAKGDVDGAFSAKRSELLNHELFRSAVDARENVDKALDDFKRFFKSDEQIAKTRDMDLVNTARAILADVGIGRSEKSSAEYLDQIRRYDPQMFETVQAIMGTVADQELHHTQLTYEDFIAIRDAVDALWDLAKTTRQIEVDGKILDREQVKEELSAQIDEVSTPRARPGYNRAVSNWDKVSLKLLSAKASLTRVEAFVDAADLGEAKGPFRKYIWNPVSEAATQYRLRKQEVLNSYQAILSDWSKTLGRKPIQAKEIDYTFRDKTELMMVVLHSGNASNLDKLLRGRSWGDTLPDGSLDRSRFDRMIARLQAEGVLTKTDYDTAQQIWDLLESLKPEAQKAHKKIHGHYFSEITANEVVTPFGRYRGGYVPAKVDLFTTEDQAIRQEREAFENNNNSFQFPTTGRGFTRSRAQNYAAPLSLEMSLLGGHIDGVLRFSYLEPTIRSVARLVQDKGFREKLSQLDPTVGKELLTPWLQRAAQQRVVLPSENGIGRILDSVARYLRTSVAMQIMTANVTNAAQQFTGVIVAASRVKPVHLRNALVTYLRAPRDTVAQILEKSPWMRSTQGSTISETYQAIDKILVDPTTFESAREFAKKHTYFLQTATQNIVNSIVWNGAYEQAIEARLDEKTAIEQADAAVRLTQGSMAPEDISRFETGTATSRLFTQFAGYFNMLANLNGTELIKVQKTVGLKKGAGRLFYVYTTAFMIPAVLSALLVKAMSGRDLDEDDDGYLNDLLSVFFSSQFKTATAMIPYGGQALNATLNSFNANRSDDRLAISPVVSFLETMAGVPAEVYKAIDGDLNSSKKVTKDVLTFLGTASSLPIGPVGRPVGYLIDVSEGNVTPSGPVDYARGLITGQRGEGQ